MQVLDSTSSSTEYCVDPVLIISSDGHAMGRMADYRNYLASRFHEDFDAFLKFHQEYGSNLGVGDPTLKALQMDADGLEPWTRDVVEAGRLDGSWDVARRLYELDAQGIAAELIFPDFGMPFELAPQVANRLRYAASPEQAEEAKLAYNRWLVDYCSAAPERLGGQAIISFENVETAIAEIRWAKDAGLKGVVLSAFSEDVPLYDPRHDPIWETFVELEMAVNTHVATTFTTKRLVQNNGKAAPHAACAFAIMSEENFFLSHQVLTHLIWGGVLERHPNLGVTLTEQGSGWIVGWLQEMTPNGSSARAAGNTGPCDRRPVGAGRVHARAGHRIRTPPASTAGRLPGSPAPGGAGPAGRAHRTEFRSASPISLQHWMIHPTGSATSPPTWSGATIPPAPAPCSPDSASTWSTTIQRTRGRCWKVSPPTCRSRVP
jgi:predicted TIM-barrel fold metal-dependent hydrolase